MGIVHGNWLTGTHSGRACKHENVYTRVNKKTGQCYSAQLCNPNPYRNEKQQAAAAQLRARRLLRAAAPAHKVAVALMTTPDSSNL